MLMNLYVFILNLYIVFKVISSQIDSSELLIKTIYHYEYKKRYLFLYTSRDNHQFSISIDLLSSDNIFKPADTYNSSIEVQTNGNRDESDNARLRKDSFYLEGNKEHILNDFPFIQLSNLSIPTKISHGSIGLAFHSLNKPSSLIYHLKNQGLIANSSFSIVNKNRLFFGGIPYNTIKNKQYSYCSIVETKGNWTCRMDDLIISLHKRNKKTNETIKDIWTDNNYITFSTDNYDNYAPKGFFKHLIEVVYKEDIEAKRFEFINSTSPRLFTFSPHYLSSAKLIFNIGNFSYTIPMWEFWLCEDELCQLNIAENPYGDFWIVGNTFYGKHDTVFNYDNKRIEFYSTKGVCTIDTKTRSNPHPSAYSLSHRYLLIINSILLVFGIGMSILINIKLNKVK